MYHMCSFKTQWKLTEWAGPAEPDCWWCLPWYLCLLEEWILSEIRSGVPWANMATKFKLNIRYVLRQIMPAFCKPQICDCFISRLFVFVRKAFRTIFVSNYILFNPIYALILVIGGGCVILMSTKKWWNVLCLTLAQQFFFAHNFRRMVLHNTKIIREKSCYPLAHHFLKYPIHSSSNALPT